MAISSCEEALEWLEKGSIELTEAESYIVDYLRQFKNIQYRWDGLKYTVTKQSEVLNVALTNQQIVELKRQFDNQMMTKARFGMSMGYDVTQFHM